MSIKQKQHLINVVILLLVLTAGLLMYNLKDYKSTNSETELTVENSIKINSASLDI